MMKTDIMNKRFILVIAGLLLFAAGLFARGDAYIYDYWGDMEKSPDAYRVSHVIYADDLKLETALKNPTSLFASGNLLYVADTDNNRIIELEYTAKRTLQFSRVIDKATMKDGSVSTFNGPRDIFVNKDGSFYIADTNNGRVLKLDKDLNEIFTLYEPDDPNYEKTKGFFPEKVVADSKGRAYVAAKNVNKGFLKYEYDGRFQGFFGANEVIYNVTDLIWKKISTQAQKEKMIMFIPVEYSNCYMDREGFIFAVTKTFDPWDLMSDKAKPIRRLNAQGKDILVKNWDPPVGDLQWGNAAGISDPSKFTDITVLENDVYLAVDESRGRIFAYDNQGRLLFAFGGRGNIDGFFRKPAAIEHIGKDLFVLDSMNASITVFTPTDYGSLIYKATEQFACGEYDQCAESWQKVLEYNGNYDLAYIGLGKAYLRKNEYKKAMDYFKVKRDRRDYSKAFKYYRKEWVESNIRWIVGIIIAAIVISLVVKLVKKIKWELETL